MSSCRAGQEPARMVSSQGQDQRLQIQVSILPRPFQRSLGAFWSRPEPLRRCVGAGSCDLQKAEAAKQTDPGLSAGADAHPSAASSLHAAPRSCSPSPGISKVRTLQSPAGLDFTASTSVGLRVRVHKCQQ